MNYRTRLYSAYTSSHVVPRKGELTEATLRLQSVHWEQTFRDFLPVDRGARIIDVGCGYGSIVWWLHQIGYSHAEGIDISAEQIALGNELGVSKIETRDARALLRERPAYYDTVFARDVLEHFPKAEVLDLLDVIYGSLKHGGLLIIHTPNAESPFGMRVRYGDFTHETAFTASSLSQLLRVTGFETLDIYPSEPARHGWKSRCRFLLWKIVQAGYRFLITIESGKGRWIVTQNLIAVARR
jgi:2-polyprenyl-3-methyl-5-hydroxy-6-metoxy-1,4-benzoquinol methylase